MRVPHLRLPHRRSAAEDLLRSNRFEDAELAFVEEAEAHPNKARPLVHQGHLALMRNDLDLAQERLSAAVARRPRFREAHQLEAEVSYRRGDFAKAAESQDAAGNRAVAAKLRSFAGRQPYEIEAPETVRVPFTQTDPLPILRGRINGGEEFEFLLDTGGAELILDTTYGKQAGIPRFGGERSVFGGGKTATVGHGAAGSLTMGEATIRNLPIQMLDLQPIGASLGRPNLIGIVGTCVLYRFLATIDYPGESLILRRKGTETAVSAEGVDVPFQMADDHFMLAEGTFNRGPPLLFFVDSGLGGGAFTCPASTLMAAGIERGSTEVVEGEGGGGTMSAWPFDVDSLSLGEARQEGLQGIGGPFPPQLEYAYGFRIGGLISHGFLSEYAVTFDFDQMTIRLDPR